MNEQPGNERQGSAKGSRVPAGTRVLVCGASFAGLATAWWLTRLGYTVTVVEIASGLRRGGTPVDIKEGTVDIVRRMGLLDAVRAGSLPPRTMEFKNAHDVTLARMPAQPAEEGEQHEIDRDTLLDILHGAVAADVDILFGCSVVRLEDGPDRVAAWFSDGSVETFALVLGCDGMRSRTRQLVFGDGGALHDLGVYAFLKVVPRAIIAPDTTQLYSVPGRTVMVNGYAGKTDIGFGFRAGRELAYDHRDKAAQWRLVRERFEDMGWRTRELLDAAEEPGEVPGEFYFDKVCQVRMPAWSKGRVALVGDAGYCPSPAAGMGGSMALVGAAALADALARHGGDHAAAFADYDTSLRPFVERVQEEAVSVGLAMFAPETDAAIAERNQMFAAA